MHQPSASFQPPKQGGGAALALHSSSPAPPLGGVTAASPAASVGESVQRLFASNTVEELVAYKQSLAAQSSAVDGDVRRAIGQRYRDLLATCEEVVGMEAVCGNVEIAKQQRVWQTAQLRASAGAGAGQMGGPSSRFALALRSAQQQLAAKGPAAGSNNNNSSINTITPCPVPTLLPAFCMPALRSGAAATAPHSYHHQSQQQQHHQQLSEGSAALRSSLSAAYAALSAKVGALRVVLDGCGAPTQLLAYAGRLDAKIAAATAAAAAAQRKGHARSASPSAGGLSPVGSSARLRSIGSNAASPSAASPAVPAGGNGTFPIGGGSAVAGLTGAAVDALLSSEPLPPATATAASLLFCHAAEEHSRLLALARSFSSLLRRIANATDATAATVGAPPMTGATNAGRMGGASADGFGGAPQTDREFVEAMAASLQQQLLPLLTPSATRTSPSFGHHSPARGSSSASSAQTDIRSQLEGLVVKAIREAHRRPHTAAAAPVATQTQAAGGVGSPAAALGAAAVPATAVGPATRNALLLFYSDLHQALTAEELLASEISTSDVQQHQQSAPLRALLRLIALQEAAAESEIASVAASSAAGNNGGKRPRTAAVLAAAKLCIRGVNGLLCYLSEVLGALRASSGVDTAALALGLGAKAPLRCAPPLAGSTAAALMRLAAASNAGAGQPHAVAHGKGVAAAAPANSPATPKHSSGGGIGVASAVATPPFDDHGAYLSAMLLNVCGAADVAPSGDPAGLAVAPTLPQQPLAQPQQQRASFLARIAHLTALLRAPAPAPAASTAGSSPAVVCRSVSALLLLSLSTQRRGDGPNGFLHWSVGAGANASDISGGGFGLTTPPRAAGGPEGAWALSPSPPSSHHDALLHTPQRRGFGVSALSPGGPAEGGASISASDLWGPSLASAMLSSAAAGAANASSALGDEAEATVAAITARVAELQRSLGGLMFGGEKGQQLSHRQLPSLLSLLLSRGASEAEPCAEAADGSPLPQAPSAAAAKGAIASAQALQSLEALLLSAGTAACDPAVPASTTTPLPSSAVPPALADSPAALTASSSSYGGWDAASWATEVEVQLSSFIVGAVASVVRSVAATLLHAASSSSSSASLGASASSSSTVALTAAANAPLLSVLSARDLCGSDLCGSGDAAMHRSAAYLSSGAAEPIGALRSAHHQHQQSSSSAAADATASASAALAAVESIILSRIRLSSRVAARGGAAGRKGSAAAAEKAARQASAPSASATPIASCVAVVSGLLEALTGIIGREQSRNGVGNAMPITKTSAHSLLAVSAAPPSSLPSAAFALRDAAAAALTNELLGPLEQSVAAHEAEQQQQKATTCNAARHLPPLAPFLAALGACLDALVERVTAAAAAAQSSAAGDQFVGPHSTFASPVSATASGIFPNGLLGLSTAGAATSSQSPIPSAVVGAASAPLVVAAEFIAATVRPRLGALIVRCFTASWLPSLAGGFGGRLADGWRRGLVGSSCVPVAHDYSRLSTLLRAGVKAYAFEKRRGARRKGKKASASSSSTPQQQQGDKSNAPSFRSRQLIHLLRGYTEIADGPEVAAILNGGSGDDAANVNGNAKYTAIAPKVPTTAAALNKAAQHRFNSSVGALLWRSETLSTAAGNTTAAEHTTVSVPTRAHPAVTSAIAWVQQSIAADLKLVFAADDGATVATAAGSNNGNSSNSLSACAYARAAAPNRLAAATAERLAPSLLAALQAAALGAAQQTCAEASAAKARASTAEAALAAVLSGVAAAQEEESAKEAKAKVRTTATSAASGSKAPSAAAVGASAPAAAAPSSVPAAAVKKAEEQQSGWGNDDDDFELDYSDDDASAAQNSTNDPTAAAAAAAPEAAAAEDSSSAGGPNTTDAANADDDEADAVECDGLFGLEADEDCAYAELADHNANEATGNTAVDAETFHGACEEIFIQISFDLWVLEKALGANVSPSAAAPHSPTSPTVTTASAQWAQQCQQLAAACQREVDPVHWSLTTPLARRHADAFFAGGQLLWGVCLTPASLSTRSWAAGPATAANASSVASPLSMPPAIGASALTGGASAVPTLLLLPAHEVERMPLLPVALPQASTHAVGGLSLPPAPSVANPSGASSGLGLGIGSGAAASRRGAATAATGDDAASRLVHGATASLKSFLGGWRAGMASDGSTEAPTAGAIVTHDVLSLAAGGRPPSPFPPAVAASAGGGGSVSPPRSTSPTSVALASIASTSALIGLSTAVDTSPLVATLSAMAAALQSQAKKHNAVARHVEGIEKGVRDEVGLLSRDVTIYGERQEERERSWRRIILPSDAAGGGSPFTSSLLAPLGASGAAQSPSAAAGGAANNTPLLRLDDRFVRKSDFFSAMTAQEAEGRIGTLGAEAVALAGRVGRAERLLAQVAEEMGIDAEELMGSSSPPHVQPSLSTLSANRGGMGKPREKSRHRVALEEGVKASVLSQMYGDTYSGKSGDAAATSPSVAAYIASCLTAAAPAGAPSPPSADAAALRRALTDLAARTAVAPLLGPVAAEVVALRGEVTALGGEVSRHAAPAAVEAALERWLPSLTAAVVGDKVGEGGGEAARLFRQSLSDIVVSRVHAEVSTIVTAMCPMGVNSSFSTSPASPSIPARSPHRLSSSAAAGRTAPQTPSAAGAGLRPHSAAAGTSQSAESTAVVATSGGLPTAEALLAAVRAAAEAAVADNLAALRMDIVRELMGQINGGGLVLPSSAQQRGGALPASSEAAPPFGASSSSSSPFAPTGGATAIVGGGRRGSLAIGGGGRSPPIPTTPQGAPLSPSRGVPPPQSDEGAPSNTATEALVAALTDRIVKLEAAQSAAASKCPTCKSVSDAAPAAEVESANGNKFSDTGAEGKGGERPASSFSLGEAAALELTATVPGPLRPSGSSSAFSPPPASLVDAPPTTTTPEEEGATAAAINVPTATDAAAASTQRPTSSSVRRPLSGRRASSVALHTQQQQQQQRPLSASGRGGGGVPSAPLYGDVERLWEALRGSDHAAEGLRQRLARLEARVLGRSTSSLSPSSSSTSQAAGGKGRAAAGVSPTVGRSVCVSVSPAPPPFPLTIAGGGGGSTPTRQRAAGASADGFISGEDNNTCAAETAHDGDGVPRGNDSDADPSASITIVAAAMAAASEVFVRRDELRALMEPIGARLGALNEEVAAMSTGIGIGMGAMGAPSLPLRSEVAALRADVNALLSALQEGGGVSLSAGTLGAGGGGARPGSAPFATVAAANAQTVLSSSSPRGGSARGRPPTAGGQHIGHGQRGALGSGGLLSVSKYPSSQGVSAAATLTPRRPHTAGSAAASASPSQQQQQPRRVGSASSAAAAIADGAGGAGGGLAPLPLARMLPRYPFTATAVDDLCDAGYVSVPQEAHLMAIAATANAADYGLSSPPPPLFPSSSSVGPPHSVANSLYPKAVAAAERREEAAHDARRRRRDRSAGSASRGVFTTVAAAAATPLRAPHPPSRVE